MCLECCFLKKEVFATQQPPLLCPAAAAASKHAAIMEVLNKKNRGDHTFYIDRRCVPYQA